MLFRAGNANINLQPEEDAIAIREWKPLNREQALAARDFSSAGKTFVDHKRQINEILYAILTPVGYDAYVSVEAVKHIEKHPIASRHKNNIAYILNNSDLITPNHEEPETHIFYKSLYGKLLLAAPVQEITNLRFLATLYEIPYTRGLEQGLISANDFLYVRGGFKWKKWK